MSKAKIAVAKCIGPFCTDFNTRKKLWDNLKKDWQKKVFTENSPKIFFLKRVFFILYYKLEHYILNFFGEKECIYKSNANFQICDLRNLFANRPPLLNPVYETELYFATYNLEPGV